jgi:hypothetical protein
MDSLKVLDPKWPIREADIALYPKAHPWQTLGGLLLAALGIPLAVPCFGWAVGWAFAGF